MSPSGRLARAERFADTGSAGTGSADAGSAGTGSADTGSAGTAPAGTAPADLAPADTGVAGTLELSFAERERSRFRARLRSGEEIGIDLAPGTLIRHGARLQLDDGRIIAVEAASEALLEVRADDGAQLARLAYHIGNRHVPLQVGDGWLRLLPDHVLRAMIEGLGGRVRELRARFEPEAGAYGHGHVHHQHDDQGHGGQIHAFDPRHEHPHRC
ncbi:MAG: urease accessory protein UreE [Burkholderiales bacterium]|nr:MAG: urease accessory protein UreE [Burkholderiales bacterium]